MADDTSPTPVTIETYEYDGLYRRIEKRTEYSGGVAGVVYDYFYDGHQVVEERLGDATNPIAQYVWHPHYIDALAVRYYDSDTDGSLDGDPSEGAENDGTHYYLHDANFNVTAVVAVITDGEVDTTTVLERYHYTPYGELTTYDAAWANSSTLSRIANPYLYTGRRFDAKTGLYHYRTRPYHAQLGRFLGRDKIGYGGGDVNLYNYVGNGPLSWVDPFGLMPPEMQGYAGDWADRQIFSYGLRDARAKAFVNDDGFGPWVDNFFDDIEAAFPNASDDDCNDALGYAQSVFDGAYDELDKQIRRAAARRKRLAEASVSQAMVSTGGMGTLDWIQGGLDVAGMIPGLGIFPDGANTLISLGRGNWGEAGMNALAMIPIIGQGTKGGQLLYKGGKALNKAGDAARAINKAGDACKGGERDADKFRRVSNNLSERLAMDEAMGGSGSRIMGEMGDPRFKGMHKMQHVHRNPDGTKTTIHYIFDPFTGRRMDFKFK